MHSVMRYTLDVVAVHAAITRASLTLAVAVGLCLAVIATLVVCMSSVRSGQAQRREVERGAQSRGDLLARKRIPVETRRTALTVARR